MGKLRVGIAGPGKIAQGVHIPVYKNLEDVEITAVFSRSIDRGKAIAEKYGIPYYFDNYTDMLASGKIDAVSVCVPNKFHAPMTIQALEAGCHVLCEKPPSISAEEAVQMNRAAEKAEKVLSFNLQFRHNAKVKAIRSFICGGEVGHIYSARVHALRRRGIPGWGVYTDKDLQGGGSLIDIGIHMLDAALYLMDYPAPSLVMGATHRQIGNQAGSGLMGEWDPDQFTVEDAAMGMIRFEDGQSLMLETSFALNMEKTDEMSIKLFGDKGGVSVFPPSAYQEKHGHLTNTTLPFLEEQNMHGQSLADFVDSCFGRKEPLVRPREFITLQRTIQALYDSAESGQAIVVK